MNQLYLCKADGSLLGTMTGLQPESCILKKNAADLWELSFTVSRYIDLDSQLVQSDYYDSIDELMQICLDGDEPVFFMIDTEPSVSNDGSQETKSVTAHSIECELNRKLLKNFKINCGTQDSLEYLVTDENGNFNNLNEYTGLPYEYISLVNYENPRLSLLHLALEDTDWTVSQGIDADLCKIHVQFEVSSESIYSFLMKQVSPAVSVIFTFDRKNKTVGAVRFQDYGEDTGVFIGLRSIVNRIDIQSSSDDGICTRLIPSGADRLGIEYVNFGDDFLINLDYFMNTLNEYGSFKYVSRELHDKYRAWKFYREEELITTENFTGTRREYYASLSRQYNQTILDINELKNRLPNDGCSVNYKTYKLEELKAAYTAYQNALGILLALYKDENGVAQIGPPPEYTPLPSGTVNIKDTVYWFDFYAYTERIIPSVEQALKMYCKTDSSIATEPDSYLYEWTLYGSDELESRKKAWSETAALLFKDCFVTSGTPSLPLSYRTPDAAGWNGLNTGQKSLFTSMNAFIQQLNQYLDYMSFHLRDNSLTGTRCKGIIRQCEDAITARKEEIRLLTERQRQISEERNRLARSVMPQYFTINGETVFCQEDLITINSLLKEQVYNNENILITDLDNIVSAVDAQEALYQDAIKELHRLSQPQYSFTTDTDNLFALPDFEPVREHFKVGNFIRLNTGLYDDEFVKLRLVSIEHNPLRDTDNMTVKFSTMIKSLDGISDLAFMLDGASGSSTGSPGSSSGNALTGSSGNGSGSFFGSHNAMIQISNNVLNALLNTELFGTAVTDVILDRLKANKGNFNTLFSHSGIFDSLEAGQIRINGDCLFDCIKSKNWNGTTTNPIDNTTGSILNLSDGTCNLGGKLKWDGRALSIDGDGKFTGTVMATAGSFKGIVNATGGTFKGDIVAESLTLADQGTFSCGKQEADHSGKFVNISSDGFLQADNAIVRGTIYAKDGKFTGDIVANDLTANNSGSIAGWKFNSNGFYQNTPKLKGNGMYMGTDGLSVNNCFVVEKEGAYFKSKDWKSPSFENYIGDDHNSLLTLLPGQWIKVYIYNIKNIEYFELSWLYDLSVLVVPKDEPDSQGGVAVFGITEKYYISGWSVAGRTERVDEYADGNDVITFTRQYHELYRQSDYAEKMQEFSDDFIARIDGIAIRKLYSSGRTISGRYFSRIEIGKIEVYNADNTLANTIYGTRTNQPTGMMVNALSKHICIDAFNVSNDRLLHPAVYQTTTTQTPNLHIDPDGRFMRTTSSSRRYKTDITSDIADEIAPERLYDLNVVSYKYKDDYISDTDQRYRMDVVGLIAEDVYEKYPVACSLDRNGKPEMWDIHILFPAALKLIQQLHQEIESLKQQLNVSHNSDSHAEYSGFLTEK